MNLDDTKKKCSEKLSPCSGNTRMNEKWKKEKKNKKKKRNKKKNVQEISFLP